jgi:hypothetical protein
MKFEFPVWLKGTEAEQAAESERQRLALASHSRAKLSEAERLVGRGQLLETTARQNLELSAGKNKEARILAENQLADAMAMGGKYALAAETHNDAVRRKYFRDVVAALERDDNEKCPCKDDHVRFGEQDVAITPRFERGKIFSPIHNSIVSLIECKSCGHLNARPPRSRLLPMQAALNQNEAAARGKGRVMKSDAEVLA